MGLLSIDLDGFKLVNDTYGHPAGDRLLKLLADDAIKENLRPYDIACRPGGDEFAVILPHASADQAETIAERILMSLAHPFFVKSAELTVTTSIGIALSESLAKRKDSPETLLQDADAAMYKAKETGRARFVVFTQALRDLASERLELETAQ